MIKNSEGEVHWGKVIAALRRLGSCGSNRDVVAEMQATSKHKLSEIACLRAMDTCVDFGHAQKTLVVDTDTVLPGLILTRAIKKESAREEEDEDE